MRTSGFTPPESPLLIHVREGTYCTE